MSDVAAILFLVIFGPGLLTYVGFSTRKKRWRDSVPLLEAAIDRVAGIEPPARNRIDHLVMLFQLGAMTFVGLVFTGLGLFIILKDSGILE